MVPQPSPSCPTILLLHGWTATADLNFANLYGPLAGRFGLVAPDIRGHGGGPRSASPFLLEQCADDAVVLVQHLGAAPVILLGYSMGGAVALLLARRHPEIVSGVILCATAAHFGSNPVERAALATLGVAGRTAQTAMAHLLEVKPERAQALRHMHTPLGHDLTLVAEAADARVA
jgi:pimeloyl-ACP methyl ester carboxylesterase